MRFKAKNKKLAIIAVCLGFIFGAWAVMNMEVSIRQGINGHVRQIKMPLYIKAMEFLSRHYEYQRITGEITRGCDTDEKKVLALFDWTHKNIRPTPPGMPIVDDHILNIIIRGYGENDQSQDVFTNLCYYTGIPSFWKYVYTKGHAARHPLSFVKLEGKWRVFDSYYGKYFRTKNGKIAGVEDIIADKSIIEDSDIADRREGRVLYKDFYYNLKPVDNLNKAFRPEKQSPLRRIIFEIKKALGIEKEELSI